LRKIVEKIDRLRPFTFTYKAVGSPEGGDKHNNINNRNVLTPAYVATCTTMSYFTSNKAASFIKKKSKKNN